MNTDDQTMDEHARVQQLLPAYAIKATEPEESQIVERHLQHCEVCRTLLDDYTRLAEVLLYTVPPVQAPASLEERVMEHVQSTSLATATRAAPRARAKGTRSSFPFPRVHHWAAVAALLLLFITNGYWISRLHRMEQRVALEATAIAFLADAQRIPVQGDAPAPEAGGVLILRPDLNIALLHLDRMPPLPAGKAYQVWLIRDGQRDSGAVFRVHGEKEITVLIQAPRPLGEYEAIGITVEPEKGSPSPTGPRVIKGRLRQEG